MRIYQEGKRLIIADGVKQVWIDPWGENSLRVRMTAQPEMDSHDWALTEPVADTASEITFETIDVTDPWYQGEEYKQYHQTARQAQITNGKITARISHEGWISYYNQKGQLLTAEYWRNRNRINRYCVPLRVDARELKPIAGTTVESVLCRQKASTLRPLHGVAHRSG